MTAPTADAVAASVLQVPHVSELGGGVAGEVATYLPGRSVRGVRITDDRIEIHIEVLPDRSMPAIAADVRAAVRPLAGDRSVDVTIDEIALTPPTPEEQQ